MNKDKSDIPYLQKGGFRAKRHGDAPPMFLSCRMALFWFQTIWRERFIESAMQSNSKTSCQLGLDEGYYSKRTIHGKTTHCSQAAGSDFVGPGNLLLVSLWTFEGPTVL